MITLYDEIEDLDNHLSDMDILPNVFTASTTRTFPNATSNRPPGFSRDVRLTRWKTSDNQQVFVNSPLITKPQGIISVAIGIAGKNELSDRGFQIAYYVEDHNGELYGDGQTMSLPPSGEWNLTQVPVTVPDSETQLRVRVIIRSGGSDTTDNCQGLVINPWLSFDLDYDHLGS